MKRISFFSWSLMLAVLVSGLVVTGCESDDDEGFNYPMETLYGTWVGTGIYIESEGKWIDPTSSWLYDDLEFSITFYENGKYYGKGFFGTGSGTYKAEGNTITTYVDGEMYLYYKVTSLTNNKAELTMYDGSGDSMKLRVTKKSSASSEIPSYEPKEEVELKLDYTFAESGSMTRAMGSEIYTDFYDKYINTKVLTPTTYSLTFKNKETGATAKIKGYWKNNDAIRLPEGEYIVTGTSYPTSAVYNSSDSVFIAFQDTVIIKKDMTELILKAKYDSFLLMFDSENSTSIVYDAGASTNSSDSRSLKKTAEGVYYVFLSGVYSSGDTKVTVSRNNNKTSVVYLYEKSFTKGKYYYFNDMTNSFDIPMMESGN